MEKSNYGDIKRAVLESVNRSSDSESESTSQYNRDETRKMFENVLKSNDIVEDETTNVSQNIANKVRRALWPEFDLEAKRLKAQKNVERKAVLMHLKEVLGEKNGRTN